MGSPRDTSAALPDGLPADAERLGKLLDQRPVLWVGAGTSIAAGYPSTARLVAAMIAAADEPDRFSAAMDFTVVADEFIRQFSRGTLGDLLQRELGPPHPPAPLHRALARLAAAGCFRAVLTTNYDDLLERALADEGVACVLQTLDGNQTVGDHDLRLIKLHGSRDDWLNAILSGQSYQSFNRRYRFLTEQLDVLLQQNWLLLAGCSLQDPRILRWLERLPEDRRQGLKPWRPLMTRAEWDAALAADWSGRPAAKVLVRAPVRPLILEDHGQLGRLLTEVAARRAPRAGHQRLELVLTIGDRWNAQLNEQAGSLAPSIDWQFDNPLDGLQFAARQLRDLGLLPLPTADDGTLAGPAAAAAGQLRQLAESVGRHLSEKLLSPVAGERIVAAIRHQAGAEPPLLLIRVRFPAAAPGAAAAERALALPWELLYLDGGFPVEQGTLDIAREALVEGPPELEPPDRPLSIVATVAAPVDASTLDHEDECYRLWRALGQRESCLLITDLGTVESFEAGVGEHHPPVVHFTGHGRPGGLLFEDEAALSVLVSVDQLVQRLRGAGFPRLIYLASCHGQSLVDGPQPASITGQRMTDPVLTSDDPARSTAAALHAAGVPQVVAYFGPVGDEQSTRAEAVFYAALAAGNTARQAVRRARRESAQPLRRDGRAAYVYPLGWAQLALYHRGPDHATTLAVGPDRPLPDLFAQQRQRVVQQLDQLSGLRSVRGVQQLRFGFVGRRKPRSEAIRRWRGGQRVLVVQGLGGLGKTALCAEVAPILAKILAESDDPPHVVASLRDAPRSRVSPSRDAGLGETGLRGNILALDGRTAGARPQPIQALWEEIAAADSCEDWQQILAQLQQDGITGRAAADAVLELARRRGSLLVYLDDAESIQVPLAPEASLPPWASAAPAAASSPDPLGRWLDDHIAEFWSALTAAAEPAGRFGCGRPSARRPRSTWAG